MQKFQFKLWRSLSSKEFTAWSGSSSLSLARVWAKNRAPAFKSHCHVRRGLVIPYYHNCALLRAMSNLSLLQEGDWDIFHQTAITACWNSVWFRELSWLLSALLFSSKTLTQANTALCTTGQPHSTPVPRPLQHLHSTFDFTNRNCLTLICRCFDDELTHHGKGERKDFFLSHRDHWKVTE